jgi:hypothetical protein
MRPLLLLALLALPSLAGAQGAHRELIDKGEHPRALARLEKDLERDPADAAALYSLAHLQDLPTYGGRDVDQAYATVLRATQAIATADARALERWARDGVNAGAVRDLRELIVAHALQQALQRNTMDACCAFLHTYAAEPATVLDQARARLAQLAYVDARNANTIAAYEQFLRDHPGAGEGADARERIAILAFDALAGSTGSAPYRDYLARHPAGPRSAQARAERERWEFRENARPGDAQGYVDYIRNNPSSAALQEARDSLRAAGGPPEGYQFRRTTAPPGEHRYVDELRGLVLVNVGGKRYTDIPFRFSVDDPAPDEWGLINGKTYSGGFAGLDFGYSGGSLVGDETTPHEIIIGGKWGLRNKLGDQIIAADHDDIYPVGDYFCACRGGTYRKSWQELTDDEMDEMSLHYSNRSIEVTKGRCALWDTKGIKVDYGDHLFAIDPRYDTQGEGCPAPPFEIPEEIGLQHTVEDMSSAQRDDLGVVLIAAASFTLHNPWEEFFGEALFYFEVDGSGSTVLWEDRWASTIKPYLLKRKSWGHHLAYDRSLKGVLSAELEWVVPKRFGSVFMLRESDGNLLFLVAAKTWMESGLVGCSNENGPYEQNDWNIFDAHLQKLILPKSYCSIIPYPKLFLVSECSEEGSFLKGLFDRGGRELVPVMFDEIQALGDGLFAIAKGTKWGLTNSKGDKLLLLEHTFEEVERKAARFQ